MYVVNSINKLYLLKTVVFVTIELYEKTGELLQVRATHVTHML